MNTEGAVAVPAAELSPQGDMRAEGQLLQALMMHWIHEDNLYWTQFRHLLILQLAAIGTWSALDATPFNLVVMIAAALLSWRLCRLADTIRVNRDINLPAIAAVSLQVASPETAQLVKSRLGAAYDPDWGLARITQHRLTDMEDAGQKFQSQVFYTCIFLDILLCVPIISDQFFGTSIIAWLAP